MQVESQGGPCKAGGGGGGRDNALEGEVGKYGLVCMSRRRFLADTEGRWLETERAFANPLRVHEGSKALGTLRRAGFS